MKSLRGLLPQCRFINLYGSTEVAADATGYRCGGESDEEHAIVIGRPISNTRLYVLDEWLEPVPIGVSGELYIGGLGLARGYLNRAGLTAQRFIANPFGEAQRLYRSGDLVRYRADGNLEFIGRRDDQVKVRGYRIELGEVESALLSHAGVSQAVVVARQEETGEKRLVGYYVASAAALEVKQLRSHLKQRLPEHMVPGGWEQLQALPLSANGKIDRKALPAPEGRPQTGEYLEPRTELERVLAGIWAEVLCVEQVGIEDNFFELGGHSLLAMRVVAQAREVLQIELAVRALFESPTISVLAQHVEALRRGGGWVLPTLAVQERPRFLPLSHAQERLWFLEQLGLVGSAYNVPTVLCMRGVLDLPALQLSVEELIRRHESLRTRFENREGQAVQIIDEAGGFRLLQVDVSGLADEPRPEQVRRLVQEEAERRFDLAQGPLFRVSLLKLGAEEHVLLLTLHHIISDGWSQGVMLRELSVLYGAFSQGLPSPLTPLPIQYADYALWQRGWLQGEVLEEQVRYWKERLAGAAPRS